MKNILTNSYVIAVIIPLVLLLCGALAKKIVRGGGWRRSDFFLGVELSLAALGAAMVYGYDLQKITIKTGDGFDGLKLASTFTFIAICFFILLWILSTHQDWESRVGDIKLQMFWLGFVCNFVGVFLFAGFVILVKGV